MDNNAEATGEHVLIRGRSKAMGLKPCPFCGADGEVWEQKAFQYTVPHPTLDGYFKWSKSYDWAAGCSKGDCLVGEHFNSEEEATEAWNSRAGNADT